MERSVFLLAINSLLLPLAFVVTSAMACSPIYEYDISPIEQAIELDTVVSGASALTRNFAPAASKANVESEAEFAHMAVQGRHLWPINSDSPLSDPKWQSLNGVVTDGSALWYMQEDGRNYYQTLNLPADSFNGWSRSVSKSWQLLAAEDLNADSSFGETSISIWYHAQSGRVAYQESGARDIFSSCGDVEYTSVTKNVLRVDDHLWSLIAVEDFTGNGSFDLLWRHQTSGVNWLVPLDGSRVDSDGYGVNKLSTEWQLASTGDFNGDGHIDLLWRHKANGLHWLTFLEDGRQIGSQQLSQVDNLNWEVTASFDYNGDGTSDLLWKNTVSQKQWLMLIEDEAISYTQGIDFNSSEAIVPDFKLQISQEPPSRLNSPIEICARTLSGDVLSGVNYQWNSGATSDCITLESDVPKTIYYSLKLVDKQTGLYKMDSDRIKVEALHSFDVVRSEGVALANRADYSWQRIMVLNGEGFTMEFDGEQYGLDICHSACAGEDEQEQACPEVCTIGLKPGDDLIGVDLKGKYELKVNDKSLTFELNSLEQVPVAAITPGELEIVADTPLTLCGSDSQAFSAQIESYDWLINEGITYIQAPDYDFVPLSGECITLPAEAVNEVINVSLTVTDSNNLSDSIKLQ